MNYEVKYAVGMNEFIVTKVFKHFMSENNHNPIYKELVEDYYQKQNIYTGSSAVFVKTTMLASAISAAAFILA